MCCMQAQHKADRPAELLEPSQLAELDRLASAQALQLQRAALQRTGVCNLENASTKGAAAWEDSAQGLAQAAEELADLQTSALLQERLQHSPVSNTGNELRLTNCEVQKLLAGHTTTWEARLQVTSLSATGLVNRYEHLSGSAAQTRLLHVSLAAQRLTAAVLASANSCSWCMNSPICIAVQAAAAGARVAAAGCAKAAGSL